MDFNYLKNVILFSWKTQLDNLVTQEQITKTIGTVYEMANMVRPVAIIGGAQIETVWNSFRKNDELLDLLLDMTEQFIFTMRMDGKDINKLADDYVEVLLAMLGGDTNVTIDKIMLDRSIAAADKEKIKGLYKSNPWFLFLMLSRQMGVLSLMGTYVIDARPKA